MFIILEHWHRLLRNGTEENKSTPWVSSRDSTLIERGNLRKQWMVYLFVEWISKLIWCKSYSDHQRSLLSPTSGGHILKMSGFTPYWILAIFGPPSLLTFHKVKSHGGGGAEGEPGRLAREPRTKENKENNTRQTEIKQQRKTGDGTNDIRTLCPFKCSGCLGVQVFRVFEVNDIWEGQKGDKGGSPKKAKIQYGVKPDIFKITKWCKEYTSCHRKLATETLQTQQEERHEYWGQAWDKPHQQQVQHEHAQHAQHLSMNARAHLVTLFDVGSHAPRGSSSESHHVIHVHVRLSLSSLSTSICLSPSSPSSSFSCTCQWRSIQSFSSKLRWIRDVEEPFRGTTQNPRRHRLLCVGDWWLFHHQSVTDVSKNPFPTEFCPDHEFRPGYSPTERWHRTFASTWDLHDSWRDFEQLRNSFQWMSPHLTL